MLVYLAQSPYLVLNSNQPSTRTGRLFAVGTGNRTGELWVRYKA